MMKQNASIESEFLDLDPENKIAFIRMKYEKPSDIFRENTVTKIPFIGESFFGEIFHAFDLTPKHYKVDLEILFSDLEEYNEQELEEIFRKNVLMESAVKKRQKKDQNSLALLLCGIGLVFILVSNGLEYVPFANETLKSIIAYILDIMATVPFWGAMEIYLISNNEERKYLTGKLLQFHKISFRKAPGNSLKADETESGRNG